MFRTLMSCEMHLCVLPRTNFDKRKPFDFRRDGFGRSCGLRPLLFPLCVIVLRQHFEICFMIIMQQGCCMILIFLPEMLPKLQTVMVGFAM